MVRELVMGRAVSYMECLGHGWPRGFLYWKFRRPYGRRKLEGKRACWGSVRGRSGCGKTGKTAAHEDKSEIKGMERRRNKIGRYRIGES